MHLEIYNLGGKLLFVQYKLESPSELVDQIVWRGRDKAKFLPEGHNRNWMNPPSKVTKYGKE